MDPHKKLSTVGKPPTAPSHSSDQGTATLIVMVIVLLIIVLFCCFSAPGIRGLFKRYIFRTCDIEDPDVDNDSRLTEEASPTVILLPNGRMLVVDRRVLQSDTELMEVSADLIRPQRQLGSTPSILDSSETSKGISPTSLGCPPPTYEDVFPDFPPSYSEISLMKKNYECIDLQNLNVCAVNEMNQNTVEGDSFIVDSNMNNEQSRRNNQSNNDVDNEDQVNNNNNNNNSN